MRATPPSRTRTGVGERKTPNVASGAGPSGANRGLGGTTSLTVLVPRKAGTSRFAARGDLGSQGNPRECSGPSPLPCRCRPPARCRPHPALSCTPHARPRSHQWPGERGPGVGQGAPHGRRRATSMALCSKKKQKQEDTRALSSVASLPVREHAGCVQGAGLRLCQQAR